jgi:ribonuclease J
MAVRFTAYDGAYTIGGNKFVLEADGATLLLDFGLSYSTQGLYYEELLRPRTSRGIVDPLIMGILPPLELSGGRQLYRTDLYPPDRADNLVSWIRRQPAYRCLDDVDGLLLSHAHNDHTGSVSYLDPAIPILCSTMTAFTAKAIQDTGLSSMDQEVCYWIPRGETDGGLGMVRGADAITRPFCVIEDLLASRQAKDFWSNLCTSRELVCAPMGSVDNFSKLRVRGYPVDHSIFGATAFAIETSMGWVVYTGDLRRHGRRGHLTDEFVAAASDLHPVALICEGTNVRDGSTHLEGVRCREEDVFQSALAVVENEKGIVFADFGPRNIDRLLIFLEIASRTSRQLVITPKDAYLLEAMHCVDPEAPDMGTDSRLLLYADVKSRPSLWEKALRDRHSSRMVDATELSTRPGDYIVCFSFFDINDLPDFQLEGGSYIYSSSEAHSEEQAIDIRRLRNWLVRFGLRFVGDQDNGEHHLHASGHASPTDLAHIIRTIRPRVLIPIHTEFPQFFAETFSHEMQVSIPKIGVPIQLG